MKNILSTIMLVLISFYAISCGGNQQSTVDKKTNANQSTDQTIYVYYFHTNIRCETCVAVDEHTQNYLKVLFPEQMKNKQIVFKSINVEDKGYEEVIKKFEVWGQTLLFIKGDKAIDRTNDAFLNVTTNPDKWKSMIKAQIDDLMKE